MSLVDGPKLRDETERRYDSRPMVELHPRTRLTNGIEKVSFGA